MEIKRWITRKISLITSTLEFYWTDLPRYSHVRARNSMGKEVNLAGILICVVSVFFVGNILRIILNFYEFVLTEEIFRLA